MMREILFRGKQTDDGEWAYGYYFYDNFQDKAFITFGNNCFKIGNYCMSLDRECPNKRILSAFEVIPKTVGQYTGLTDKNGTKIFEGDIVKYGDTVHNVVFEQRNGTAYFGLVYSTLETLSFGHYQDLKQIEVIGNIYDNPELVGGQEND